MRLRSYQEIMAANRPEEIFSMNPNTLQEEYDAYCEQYKPDQQFHEIRNFVTSQQLKFLLKKAKEVLSSEGKSSTDNNSTVLLYSKTGEKIRFEYDEHFNQRVCDTYINDSEILMVVDSALEEKGLFSNYIDKVREFISFWESEMPNWKDFQYSIPQIVKSFKTQDKSKYVVLLKKPCKIYPLREVLNFFDGRMNVKHVISIIKRLYSYACWIDVAGMTHNAICIDNIYFSPGNEVMPGEKYSVNDIRIVGLYGGWYFTTSKDEKITVLPREIRDVIPDCVEKTRYSSFEVDMLSIKKVARELLGDVTGKNLYGVHSMLCEWFNRTTCEKNAYEEYSEFERICKEVFGKARFVDIDVSI